MPDNVGRWKCGWCYSFSNIYFMTFSQASYAQLYDCSRQCGRPVRAQCSMGFGPNPLINGLIQHSFKLNILFLERKKHSNTFWPDETFSYWSQVTMMFQKKIFFKNKKIRVSFSIGVLPCQARQAKKNK